MAQSSAAYNISLFDWYDDGTAAPKLDPKYDPQEPSRLPKKKQTTRKKSSQSTSRSAKKATQASFISSMKVLACVFCVFSIICAAMYLNVRLDETASKINSVESEIEIAKSENIRLNSALEGMVSIDKIEDYAENTLGMVRLENYKITYFEADAGNHVVLSGGKSYLGSSNQAAQAE